MTKKFFDAPSPYVAQKRKFHIPLHAIDEKSFSGWMKKQSSSMQEQAKCEGFEGKAGQILIISGQQGHASEIYTCTKAMPEFYSFAEIAASIKKSFSAAFLKTTSFEITGLAGEALTRAYTGWGLAAYKFDAYKKSEGENPALLWAGDADKRRVKTVIEALALLRNLINTPANDMGPQELEDVTRALAAAYKAKIKVTSGKMLEKNFPLVHAVGDSSPRRPRLIDLSWGAVKNPKITLVGKGVCFDTGGLDLKPSAAMKLMKKDMGGAAHTIALAQMIMAMKLPVRLRLIIPAVENSVSGTSFRPGDVFTSRKGTTVENTNTDAEGRLILADALTLASEDKPDLMIDYATLTGSARAALGPDIPAMFCNNDAIAAKLHKASENAEDPLWHMPLWQPYRKHNESSVADMHNSAGLPGDLIYSALFLESFLIGKPDWVHIDTYAWEHSGKAGRPAGGADCGLRAVFSYLEERYG